uniref:BOWMAN_BIRK domain-containing protein n=1 Tax=Panagrellus redivivus TaxID=6233 RepID=A0A7E5A037_PANRE
MIPTDSSAMLASVVLLVVVPLLASARPAADLPLPAFENHPGDLTATPTRAPIAALPIAVIETCTPDCTAPHCTTECKCAFTHRNVTSKCSPPRDSATASLCQLWFETCPAYNQVNYNGASVNQGNRDAGGAG